METYLADSRHHHWRSRQTKSTKDSLFLWCQMKTTDYPYVNGRNFWDAMPSFKSIDQTKDSLTKLLMLRCLCRTYYHYFSKLKQETVQGKAIGNVRDPKPVICCNRKHNSVNSQTIAPSRSHPMFVEKGNLEVLLFSLQSRGHVSCSDGIILRIGVPR